MKFISCLFTEKYITHKIRDGCTSYFAIHRCELERLSKRKRLPFVCGKLTCVMHFSCSVQDVHVCFNKNVIFLLYKVDAVVSLEQLKFRKFLHPNKNTPETFMNISRVEIRAISQTLIEIDEVSAHIIFSFFLYFLHYHFKNSYITLGKFICKFKFEIRRQNAFCARSRVKRRTLSMHSVHMNKYK